MQLSTQWQKSMQRKWAVGRKVHHSHILPIKSEEHVADTSWQKFSVLCGRQMIFLSKFSFLISSIFGTLNNCTITVGPTQSVAASYWRSTDEINISKKNWKPSILPIGVSFNRNQWDDLPVRFIGPKETWKKSNMNLKSSSGWNKTQICDMYNSNKPSDHWQWNLWLWLTTLTSLQNTSFLTYWISVTSPELTRRLSHDSSGSDVST